MTASIDPTSFPTKRVAAGVLIRDSGGNVLLVEPTYKEMWEIPGGLVEALESPREAAKRECREELGLDVAIGSLLCVHHSVGSRIPGDGVNFVFDGGTSTTPADRFELPPDELAGVAFVAPTDLGSFLPEVMVRRVRAAVLAADNGETIYLER